MNNENNVKMIESVMAVFDFLVPDLKVQRELLRMRKEFEEVFGTPKSYALSVDLVEEELSEFIEELANNGVNENLIKEYSDVIYVVIGLLSNLEAVEMKDSTHYWIQSAWEENAKVANRVASVAWEFFTTEDVLKAFTEVHRSNMSKINADGTIHRREDGKVLKPDTYSKADVSEIFNKDIWIMRMEGM